VPASKVYAGVGRYLAVGVEPRSGWLWASAEASMNFEAWRCPPSLRDHLLHDIAMYVGESKIPAGMSIDQPFVIKSQKM
jgi:hypothetical protein